MSTLTIPGSTLPRTTPEVEALIRQATAKIKPHEATFKAKMEHLLHAGMYARTCRITGVTAFTSVMIKIPTVVIVQGECCVHAGEWRVLRGYNVIAAEASRIQAYVTLADTAITMLFPSDAQTVEEAEAQFTDEWADLLSRRRPEDETVIVTGVKA